jgi:hypothetical protein
MLWVWGENPRNLHSRIKTHDVGNFGNAMLHHFEDFGKRGKFVSGANVWYVFVEIAWMHMWANVGFRENIHVTDAKWDNDN